MALITIIIVCETPEGPVAPEGYVLLCDADGAYLLDSDGAYLIDIEGT